MVAITTVAAPLTALASLTAAIPTAGAPPLFKISTCAAKGASSPFSSQYIFTEQFKTGEMKLLASGSRKDAADYQFNGTHITETFTETLSQFAVVLSDARPTFIPRDAGPTQFTAPKGYRSVDFNPVRGTGNFHSKGIGAAPLKYKGTKDFESFTLCTVKGQGSTKGPFVQLLYRTSESKKNADGQCADVTLFGLFQTGGTGKMPPAPKC